MYIIDKDHVLEKLPRLDSGLHYTYIHMIESNMVVKEKHCDPGTLLLVLNPVDSYSTTVAPRETASFRKEKKRLYGVTGLRLWWEYSVGYQKLAYVPIAPDASPVQSVNLQS
ncbi:hypothetical protein LXL04_020799 [Taraxacum kok-saghyz]